jgi:hypothetical protein
LAPEAAGAEGFALGRAEGGALVEQRVGHKAHAARLHGGAGGVEFGAFGFCMDGRWWNRTR